MGPLVVIGCAMGKRSDPAPALELYTGSYYRQTLAYARTISTDDRIVVLSGRYGLVRGDRVLSPYTQRMGREGSATREQVVMQARTLGLAHELDVVALVGESGGYAAAIRAAIPAARFPLAGLSILGRKRWLAEQVRSAQ